MSKIEVDAIEPQSGTTLTIGASGDTIIVPAGTVSLPAITTTGDTNTGIFFPAADTIAFTEGGAESMRITSAGNVGIGTSSPSQPLDVLGSAQISYSGADTYLYFQSTSNFIGRKTDGNLNIGVAGSQSIVSSVGGTERMRIDSSGNVLIGKTAQAFASKGVEFVQTGESRFTVDADNCLLLNRLTNDGILQAFFQAGTLEGTISVSGTTVSYNGFTGTHWSRFQDNSTPIILKGTVLETLDEMCDWYNLEFDVTTQDADGNDVTHTEKIPYVLQNGQSVRDVITYDWNTEKKDENDNDIIEQVQATIVKESDIKHMKSKVSDTTDAKNVYGVFVAYDEDGEGYNDFYVASVGSFVVRIKANETIAKGDLLQSNGDGTAKVQTDDAVRSSSFAKVLSTTIIETYEDGSYLVPCSLMC
jgi:hypothetical protein